MSMAPNDETSGLRTALAMGAAKAILVSDDALAGSDALGTAKVLATAIERAGPDLVLAATESTDGYTGTMPGPGRRAPRPPVGHLRQEGRGRRRHGQGRAPDRGRLRRGRVPAPRRRDRHRRRGRAPLPVLQGDHGGQVQAGRRADASPTSASTPARSAAAGARQEITDVAAADERGRRRDRRRRGRGLRAHHRVPRAAQGPLGRAGEHSTMSIDKIWVLAEVGGRRPHQHLLELITKARALAGHGRGGHLGRRHRRARRPTLGDYGVTTVYDVGDLGGALPGVAGGRRHRRRGRGRQRARRPPVPGQLRRARRRRPALGAARPARAHQRASVSRRRRRRPRRRARHLRRHRGRRRPVHRRAARHLRGPRQVLRRRAVGRRRGRGRDPRRCPTPVPPTRPRSLARHVEERIGPEARRGRRRRVGRAGPRRGGATTR